MSKQDESITSALIESGLNLQFWTNAVKSLKCYVIRISAAHTGQRYPAFFQNLSVELRNGSPLAIGIFMFIGEPVM